MANSFNQHLLFTQMSHLSQHHWLFIDLHPRYQMLNFSKCYPLRQQVQIFTWVNPSLFKFNFNLMQLEIYPKRKLILIILLLMNHLLHYLIILYHWLNLEMGSDKSQSSHFDQQFEERVCYHLWVGCFYQNQILPYNLQKATLNLMI